MKKVLAVLCVVLLAVFIYNDFTEDREQAEAKKAAAYKEAWNEGYHEGYKDGHEAATQQVPGDVAHHMSGELERIASGIQAEYSMDTDTAFGVIMNYLDGEPTESRDLNTALRVVWEYSRAVHNAIDDIGR